MLNHIAVWSFPQIIITWHSYFDHLQQDCKYSDTIQNGRSNLYKNLVSNAEQALHKIA